MDASGSDDPEVVYGQIYGHFAQLRQHPKYRRALIVLCVENNYGGPLNARRLYNDIAPQFKPVHMLSKNQKANDWTGIWTDQVMKTKYTEALRWSLSQRVVRVAHRRNFITIGRDPAPLVQKLCDQLSNYRLECKDTQDNLFMQPKQIITGKSGKSKDDLAFTLSMALYWSQNYFEDQGLVALMRQSHILID